MDSCYRFLTHSMLSRDVNAAMRLAEASWRRDNKIYGVHVVVVNCPFLVIFLISF